MLELITTLRHALEPFEVWILFGGLFGLLAIRAPIGVALGLPSFLVIFIAEGKASSLVLAVVNAMENKFLLTAIPFFILSSVFLTTGGAARKIVDFAVSAVGKIPGGMGIAGVASCMQFAALSGSSPSTVAAIGPISIDGMRKAGYPKPFAVGLIATAGTLGILIPPSIVMVVYAASTNTSVGKLFLAGVIPGLIAGLLLCVGAFVAILWRQGLRKPKDWSIALGKLLLCFVPALVSFFLSGTAPIKALSALPFIGFFVPLLWGLITAVATFYAIHRLYSDNNLWPSLRHTLKSGLIAIPGLMLIVIILIGLNGGWFTPTEAAAFAAVYGFITATVFYRGIGFIKDKPWWSSQQNLAQNLNSSLVLPLLTIIPNLFHHETRKMLSVSILGMRSSVKTWLKTKALKIINISINDNLAASISTLRIS